MLGLFVSVPLPIFNRNQGEIARADGRTREGQPIARAPSKPTSRVKSRRRIRSSSRRAQLLDRHRARSPDADAGSAGRRRPTSIRPARRRCSTCSTPSGPSTTPWTPTTPRRPPIGAPRPDCLSPSTRMSCHDLTQHASLRCSCTRRRCWPAAAARSRPRADAPRRTPSAPADTAPTSRTRPRCVTLERTAAPAGPHRGALDARAGRRDQGDGRGRVQRRSDGADPAAGVRTGARPRRQRRRHRRARTPCCSS